MLLTVCRITSSNVIESMSMLAIKNKKRSLRRKLNSFFFTGILRKYFYCFVSTNGRFGWLRRRNSRFCFTFPNCETLLCSIDKKDSTLHIEQSTFKLNDFELSSLLPGRTTYDFPLHTVKFRK